MYFIKERMLLEIAPWFRLYLPSCSPGFESKHIVYAVFNLFSWNWICVRCWIEKRTKINEKEAGIGPFFQKKISARVIHYVCNSCKVTLIEVIPQLTICFCNTVFANIISCTFLWSNACCKVNLIFQIHFVIFLKYLHCLLSLISFWKRTEINNQGTSLIFFSETGDPEWTTVRI